MEVYGGRKVEKGSATVSNGVKEGGGVGEKPRDFGKSGQGKSLTTKTFS